jgi:hypothetical protein
VAEANDRAALERRLAELEERLARVESVQAIHTLKSRYGELADRRYGPDGVVARDTLERIANDLAGLFSRDASWDGGPGLGVCRGRTAIRERFLAPTLRFSWHYFVKPKIEVCGDRASGTWDILAPCTTAEGRPMWMAGVEDDTYVKQDGVWLHQSMKLDVVFMAPHDKGWSRVHP